MSAVLLERQGREMICEVLVPNLLAGVQARRFEVLGSSSIASLTLASPAADPELAQRWMVLNIDDDRAGSGRSSQCWAPIPVE